MSAMNVSLPDSLKPFVGEQVTSRGYGTSSEFVRELIRRDQDRMRLRSLLLQGAASAPVAEATGAYFDDLRDRIRRRAPGVKVKPVIARGAGQTGMSMTVAYHLTEGSEQAAH
jgi:antitoxin ParD1/3/4